MSIVVVYVSWITAFIKFILSWVSWSSLPLFGDPSKIVCIFLYFSGPLEDLRWLSQERFERPLWHEVRLCTNHSFHGTLNT